MALSPDGLQQLQAAFVLNQFYLPVLTRLVLSADSYKLCFKSFFQSVKLDKRVLWNGC